MGQTLEQASNNYQRDEILSDTTKTDLGLETTATPDDVFGQIGEEITAVKNGQYKLLQKYTTPNTYTWTVPEGITKIIAIIVGGGASGDVECRSSDSVAACGGGSGGINISIQNVQPSQQKNIVVGAGGSSVSYSYGSRGGNAGQSSSFDSVVAVGGVVSSSYNTDMYSCVQIPTPSVDVYTQGVVPHGGQPIRASGSTYNYLSRGIYFSIISILYMLSGKQEPLFMAGGGGYADYYGGSLQREYKETTYTIDGKYPSVFISGYNNATATKSNDIGAGGGGAACITGTATSAAGCDGAVWIFGRGD